MIDISDGSGFGVISLWENNSNLGVKIFEDKVPIDHDDISRQPSSLNSIRLPAHCTAEKIMNLLFTINPTDYDKIKNHPDIHFIGHMHTDATQHVIVTKQQTVIPLTAQGWNHFKGE
jgi:thiamine-monophosphate kinase